MSVRIEQVIFIDLDVKDEIWAKISHNLVKEFCFNFRKKFNLEKFNLDFSYQKQKLFFKFLFDIDEKINYKEYIKDYGMVMSASLSLDQLFKDKELVSFKQSLDLSVLELKLLRGELEGETLNGDYKEINNIHRNFGEYLVKYYERLIS